MQPLPTSDAIGPAIAVLAAAVAAVFDVRAGRIPNVLTAGTAVAGLGLAATGAGSTGIAAALGGGVLGLGLLLPGHVLGGTGAGDVKLMAALGILLGPAAIVVAFLASALAGGVFAIGHAARRGRLATTLARTAGLVTMPAVMKAQIDMDAPATKFAYGPALALGAIAAVLWR